MKTCLTCGKTLPLDQFHKRVARCKSCKAIADKGRDRCADSPARNWTDAARARKRRWAAANADPIKQRARRILRHAIEYGKIIRPSVCQECNTSTTRVDGVAAIQAHHHMGYDRPLDVMWLCPKCHRKADAARDRKEGRSDLHI